MKCGAIRDIIEVKIPFDLNIIAYKKYIPGGQMDSKVKTGLVLEGGAMRGLFTAGVIDVLMENDIYTDGAVGVSAGAAFGCNYKSRQIGRAFRYNLRFCKDPRYCSLRSLIKTGDLYGGDFCYRVLPEQLDIFDVKSFEASPVEFYLVCTDVDTGEPVYHKCTDGKTEDLQWMRASASMPIVSNVIKISGKRLLDGGVADPIPLKYFQSIGYEKNIVVLTQPRSYEKNRGKFQFLINTMLKKYPKLAEAMKRRPFVYNQTLKYIRNEENKGNVLVIAPPEALPIGKVEHDPDRIKVVYNIGRKTALEMLDKIKEFLNDSKADDE